MRAHIIKVLKLLSASAADHMVSKNIIAYFMSSVFTSIRQCVVPVLPSPQLLELDYVFTVAVVVFRVEATPLS